jgi:hypothetical protein
MGPGASKMEFVPHYAVDQKPVWLDMGVAVAFPIPFQGMILVTCGELFAGNQEFQNQPQLS